MQKWAGNSRTSIGMWTFVVYTNYYAMYLPCGISANVTATCMAQLAKCQGPQAKKNASLAITKGPKSFRSRIFILLIHLCVAMKYYLVSQCTQDYKSCEHVGKNSYVKTLTPLWHTTIPDGRPAVSHVPKVGSYRMHCYPTGLSKAQNRPFFWCGFPRSRPDLIGRPTDSMKVQSFNHSLL